MGGWDGEEREAGKGGMVRCTKVWVGEILNLMWIEG